MTTPKKAAPQKAAAKKAESEPSPEEAKPSERIRFISLSHEAARFSVPLDYDREVRGHWNSTRDRVIWDVKAEDLELFERHHFVKSQRIVRADGTTK